MAPLFKIKKRDEKEKTGAEAVMAPVAALVEQKDEDVEKIDIIETLLSGEAIVQTLSTPYGDFEFLYPSGKEQLNISYRKVQYLNGHPHESFDIPRLLQFEKWATLDVLVTKKPPRFEKLKSWADFPDQEIVDDLYQRGSLFCGEIRQQIVEARPGKAMG